MKLKTKTKLLSLLAITVALAGCSSGGYSSTGGGSDNPYTKRAVAYTANGNSLQCLKPSDESDFTSGSYVSKTCVWFCASDSNYDNKYVSMSFDLTAGGWVVDRTYVSDGICEDS